jgi:dTDP-4-amino-4,6-dideoxygalactose transaminase
VPLFDPDLGEEEYRSVKRVLDSKWLTMGQVTKNFESAFSDYLGVKHAIAVSSGTAAMHLAHHVVGLERGDRAICPSLTFVATANAILYTGAKAVFADVESLDDLTISPDHVESRIDERTRGIVVVHIEDAAHAAGAIYSSQQEHGGSRLKAQGSGHARSHGERVTDRGQGATHNGRTHKLGTMGDIGCFSFFSNKNMTTAEGGMVVTNRDDLAEKIRIARSHGMTSLTWDRYESPDFSYDVVGPGYNYRIDELRSSLGLVQLQKLDGNNRRRVALWALYSEKLNGIEEIKIPFSQIRGISSYHIFPILLSEGIVRKEFMEYLLEQGIQTSIHYPPVHLFSYYKNLIPSGTELPLTEYVGRREVTLPLFPTMEETHINYVVNAIKGFLGKCWKGSRLSPS